MFPWASIVGLAGQAVSSVLSAKANKEAENKENEDFARQKAFYETQLYQDPLQRSENQALLGELDRKLDKQVDVAKSTSKITGATPEAQLAMQQNALDVYGDAISGMASGESARRDALNKDINRLSSEKAKADIERINQKHQNYANIASAAASAFGSIQGGYSLPKSDKDKIG